jgi:hypothetical protein
MMVDIISGYVRSSQDLFIIKCELVYEQKGGFIENRNLDAHIDQFSKIMSKCSNLKHCHLGLQYITKTTELMHAR